MFSEINAFSNVKRFFNCFNGLEESGSSDLKAVFERISQNNCGPQHFVPHTGTEIEKGPGQEMVKHVVIVCSKS